MASRTGQLLRNIVKIAPRCSTAKLSSFSSVSKIQKSTNVKINRAFPAVFQINKRFYGGSTDDESLEDKTMNVLKLFDKVDPSKVNLDAHLINDLGLDSLDVVEVVMAFEDEFGIEISDEEAEKIFTVRQAVDLIQAKSD